MKMEMEMEMEMNKRPPSKAESEKESEQTAVVEKASGKAANPRPTRDTFGIIDGTLTVGEVLGYKTYSPHQLSETAKHPKGLIPYLSAKYTKAKPATVAEEKKIEAAERVMLAITEREIFLMRVQPYYGLKTRARLLWAIAETWEEHNGPVVLLYPQWMVAVKEMRRLAKLGEV
jgi:hypothetical protein